MNTVQCIVSVASIYAESSAKSEMLSQILYGEKAEILEVNKNWSKVKMNFDGSEGWMLSSQIAEVFSENSHILAANFSLVETIQGNMLLSIGSEIETNKGDENDTIDQSALSFLNVPFLHGGRSFFGIDADGFTQLIYKKHNIKIPRKAFQQAELGEALSFVEESEAGDLAFFDDENGNIIHVGIMLEDQKIIHVSGKVRIDILDSSGIFNVDQNKHTHKLRFIKRLKP